MTKHLKIPYDLLSPSMPQMPDQLPNLVKLAISRSTEHMRPAFANGIFPSLFAQMHNVKFRYPDNVCHEPHMMTVLIGPQSVGKGGLAPIVNIITQNLREHDKQSEAKLNEWRKACKSAGANKGKPNRPDDAAILCPEPDMTNPALIQLMMDAEAEGNRFLYTNIPEIDLLDQCCGSHRKVTKLIRLLFDNSRYGAQRATENGVSGSPIARWNWNASCVPSKALSFFRDSLTDGTLGRINICYIPRNSESVKGIPQQGDYDEQYQQEMQSYIVRLQSATGEIDCPQANRLVTRLADEMSEIASLSDDENFEALSFRALVICWLKACVLYVSEGYKWSPVIARFVRWSLYYDLWSKLALFAPKLREQNDTVDTTQTYKHGPTNMLETLALTFSRDQLLALRLEHGKAESGTNDQLRKWLRRGYITYSAQTGLYTKTNSYLTRNNG